MKSLSILTLAFALLTSGVASIGKPRSNLGTTVIYVSSGGKSSTAADESGNEPVAKKLTSSNVYVPAMPKFPLDDLFERVPDKEIDAINPVMHRFGRLLPRPKKASPNPSTKKWGLH
ncbi:hypothetical protein DSO57_1015393 [Entomophthora muscae]|uniref:Uncharacterized protein n=1 Tax=Entomophthora muscae TaxID=34485 RepID=A0ACC2TSK5_9FUNG|nr:hypothetical protein DSO57_1015393 [Entomophthora muscae]